MPWKKDDNGAFVADESGNPIFIHANSDEKGIDAGAILLKLSEANAESAKRKNELREYGDKFKSFADIENPTEFYDTALKNAQLVAGMADKDKDVEERIQAQVKAKVDPLNKKLAEVEARALQAETNLAQEKVQSAFHNSKWGKEHFVDTTMAFDLLKKNFEYKDGKVIAKDKNGTVIFGENGEATLDEALPRLLDESSYKNHLLKGSSATGSGATAGSGSMGNNYKNPFSKEHRNVTEQNKIMLENPSYAKELAKQAGISI